MPNDNAEYTERVNRIKALIQDLAKAESDPFATLELARQIAADLDAAREAMQRADDLPK